MSTVDFNALFEQFNRLKVAIVGDVMLDTYWWGNTDRISPEAPVPVVSLRKKEMRVGGAANVALNTASLGAETTIISIIGEDADGIDLAALLNGHGINTSMLLYSKERITTNKMRVMSRNQQMMRLDAEITTDISAALELEMINNVRTLFQTNCPDVLIFEDYNKGVLTTHLIEQLIVLCKEFGVVSTVDPKRNNFLAFKGVDIFKPNLKEVKEGLNVSVDKIDLNTLDTIHAALHKKLEHQISLITLSEKGVFYQMQNDAKIIPTHIRSIADVSGAGDTVIAVASLVYTATKNIHLAAEMANIAGGLVCEEVGTAAINKTLFLKECNFLLQ